jgi:pyruvate,orthophosphate dikinase
VFGSWFNDRAKYYRKMNQIPDDLGTAVNVQAMVFGNMGDTSATGVGFTRNPATGEKAFYGEFLENAQGEDVVAGIRTPHPISELETWNAASTTSSRHHHQAGEALPRHAGLRVHHPGRQALHAADPQRQAHRPGRRPHRRRDGGRRPDHKKKPSCASIRSSSISCCTRCSTRQEPEELTKLAKGLPPPPAPPSARSCSPPTTPWSFQEGARHPGPQGDHAGRHPRHGSRQGHSDRARRHDQPRGRGLPRHGHVPCVAGAEAHHRQRAQEGSHRHRRRQRPSP